MATKSENTTQYILEKVAPVFNKMGYEATSMSDITEVTGLTKGAVYGNFKNKEELAIASFNYNVRRVIWHLAAEMEAGNTVLEKFGIMTDFYRNYFEKTLDLGGCPLLNVGVDSNHLSTPLHLRVVTVLSKLQNNLATLIETGMVSGELRTDLDADKLGARIVSLIQGAIFTANILNESSHIDDMMDFIDHMILTDWKK